MIENASEITLEEVKKLYTIIIQKEFIKFFDETIFPLIDYSKTSFLDCHGDASKTPTSRILLKNSDGKWLFDYDYDKKNKHFYYSYTQVDTILYNKFHLQLVECRQLMKSLVENQFNLYDVTPIQRTCNYNL